MIRIRYTFKNADGHISWNDFLSSCVNAEGALNSFAKNGPKYMLQNLIDMRLFEVVKNQYEPVENQINGIDSDIAYFINKHKA